jgi:predicted dehydrogenase
VRDEEVDMAPVRWGVLGGAAIAVNSVIPGMAKTDTCELLGVASRSPTKAAELTASLGTSRTYSSYDELLDDADIEAVYIPLPNHLHAEWTRRAAARGKHVLCEKPLALSAAEAQQMVDVCHLSGVLLMEAFMYRLHPLWAKVRELIGAGMVGDLLAVQSFFSYRNVDPVNIRNIPEFGGGALMDIGCYCVNSARMLFDGEPEVVAASIRRDPAFGTDVLTSALLDFGGRHATFTCSTQIEPNQRVEVVGTSGKLLVEIPFNIPTNRPTRVLHYTGSEPPEAPPTATYDVPTADQYAIEVEAFSRAVRSGGPVPTPPEDAVANMAVMERIVAAAR